MSNYLSISSLEYERGCPQCNGECEVFIESKDYKIVSCSSCSIVFSVSGCCKIPFNSENEEQIYLKPRLMLVK